MRHRLIIGGCPILAHLVHARVGLGFIQHGEVGSACTE
ncbi:MAG: hypothetical protein JWO71_689 [Candidatus Acidoferrum typicum]|nr:hypothetical protein [Candidatus Acidoferrum typicum]